MRATIDFRADGCWVWGAYLTPDGYARCTWKGRQGKLAYRVLFEQVFGPIPEGCQLHHECENKACVRPDHLRVVTPAAHARLSARANRTVCDQGHEYTPENTYMRPTGQRDCRACIRTRVARYKANKQLREAAA